MKHHRWRMAFKQACRRAARLLVPTVLMSIAIGLAHAEPHRARSLGSANPGVTTINGKSVPGVIKPASITLLLRAPLGDGLVLYQYRIVRSPGTRAPIHVHPNGGSTCMLSGESTMRIQGVPGARTYRAGQCVFMPTGPAMVNYNSGSVSFEALETYVLKEGEKPLKVLEPGQHHSYENNM